MVPSLPPSFQLPLFTQYLLRARGMAEIPREWWWQGNPRYLEMTWPVVEEAFKCQPSHENSGDMGRRTRPLLWSPFDIQENVAQRPQRGDSYKMHLRDVLQAQLLNRNTFGLSRNKWACMSQAFNPLSPGWSMYQQTLLLELCPYRVPLVGRRYSHGRELLRGATVALWAWYFMS